MSHDAAPATRLVAVSCCLCGRALVDAVSLERGIGPVCAEKYGADAEPTAANWNEAARLLPSGVLVEGDARRSANAAIYRVSAAPDAAEVPALVEGIRALGFGLVADRLTERLAEEGAVTVRADGDVLCVAAPFNPAFNDALRAGVARRSWDRAAKVWRVPVAERAGLWRAVRTAFRGHLLVTAAGARMIA